MKQFIFNTVSVGDAQFICEYPNYRELRSMGYTKQELEPLFLLLREHDIMNHYEYNGQYFVELESK